MLSLYTTTATPDFHRVSKSAKFSVFFKITCESLNFELPVFENAARYPDSETKVLRILSYVLAKFGKLGPCTLEKALSVATHPLNFFP